MNIPLRAQTNASHFTSYRSGNSGDLSTQPKAGTVLMGGSTDVDEAFKWMIDRSDGGDFLVLRATGSDGYNDYVQGLGKVNSVESVVCHDREASYDPALADKIDKCEAIFLAGGDQSKYLSFWRDTPVQEALQRALDRGVPIGGTSAGLAVLGSTIFSADQGGVDSDEMLAHPNSEKLTLQPELVHIEATQGLLTDTHFSQRDRMGRLTAFLAKANHGDQSIRGIGVDEKTAVLVEASGEARVVGTNSVYWVNPTQKACDGEPLQYDGLKVKQFKPGSQFNLTDWNSSAVGEQSLSVNHGSLVWGPKP